MAFHCPDGKSDSVDTFLDVSLPDLLGLPPAKGRCPRATWTCVLESRERPGRQRVSRVPCRCWSCPPCAAFLRAQAGTHYGTCIALAAGALFHVRVPQAEWKAVRQQLRRRNASWVRVKIGDGQLVIGSAPLCFGVPLSDKGRAVRLLGDTLASVRRPDDFPEGHRHKPVNSSPDWNPPPRRSRYRLLGWLRAADPDAVVTVLATFGIYGTARRGDGGTLWDVTYAVPPSWIAADKERLRLALRSIGK